MNDAASTSSPSAPVAVILAAGKGTRMGGDLPKVLYPVADRPMVAWVVEACRQVGVKQCILVIGYKGELVREAFAGQRDVIFVEQTEQLGTAHATQMAVPHLQGLGHTPVFVLAGDGPLIRADTLQRVLETHHRHSAAATLATAVIDDPTGYGRILRDDAGRFIGIVEQKDATDLQRQVREVNPSYYCFEADALLWALPRVSNDNRQGEYYVTDVPMLLQESGRTVAVVDAVPREDVLSINTPQQLAEVDALLRSRLADRDQVGIGGPR